MIPEVWGGGEVLLASVTAPSPPDPMTHQAWTVSIQPSLQRAPSTLSVASTPMSSLGLSYCKSNPCPLDLWGGRREGQIDNEQNSQQNSLIQCISTSFHSPLNSEPLALLTTSQWPLCSLHVPLFSGAGENRSDNVNP